MSNCQYDLGHPPYKRGLTFQGDSVISLSPMIRLGVNSCAVANIRAHWT